MLKNLGSISLTPTKSGGLEFQSKPKRNANTSAVENVRNTVTAGTTGSVTSQGGGKSVMSGIKGNYNLPAMTGYLPDMDDNAPPVAYELVRKLCRDMFRYDAIAGGVVELLSTLPWSEAVLSGASSKARMQKFGDSVNAMNIKSAFPEITIEYLVNGVFIADGLFDKTQGTFTGMAPHDPANCNFLPLPVYGRDPLISVNIPPEYAQLQDQAKDNPHAKKALDDLGDHFKAAILKGNVDLDPATTLYVPRRTFATEVYGTPFLQRVLPLWLLEKALMRGTIDSAYRRQKPIVQVMAGDEDYVPTIDEMQAIAARIQEADRDPVSGILVTRQSVSINEILSPTSFWRWDETNQTLTDHKLKGLGASESFLGGDVNLNTMDASLSVFVERIAYMRWIMTNAIFYNKIFKHVAESNDFRAKNKVESSTEEKARKKQEAEWSRNSTMIAGMGIGPNPASYVTGDYATTASTNSQLEIPRLTYVKHLKPEGDSAYLDLLDKMTAMNIPIPLRMYAAAAGVSLDEVMSQQDDDIKLRERMNSFIEKRPKTAEQEAGNLFNENESAMVSRWISQGNKSRVKRRGLMNRNFAAYEDMKDPDTGRVLTRKGKAVLNERVNRSISESMGRLNFITNRKQKAKKS